MLCLHRYLATARVPIRMVYARHTLYFTRYIFRLKMKAPVKLVDRRDTPKSRQLAKYVIWLANSDTNRNIPSFETTERPENSFVTVPTNIADVPFLLVAKRACGVARTACTNLLPPLAAFGCVSSDLCGSRRQLLLNAALSPV